MNTEIIGYNDSIEKQLNYSIGKVNKLELMTPNLSLSDIVLKESNIKPLKTLLLTIFARYLSVNVKSRAINNEFGYKLLIDFFLDECKNLEIQEIEFIFKNGVLGRFGQIYNDISIDTICGKNGWVEVYYDEFRKHKPENIIKEEGLNFTGKEMSLSEFYDTNPEYKKRNRILELSDMAKQNKCGVQELKEFYKLKGFSVGEMQDDISTIAGRYYKSEYFSVITEAEYIKNWINSFIKENFNKKK